MSSEYKVFNIILLACSLFFVLGIFWLWRGVMVSFGAVPQEEIEAVPYAALYDGNSLEPVRFGDGSESGSQRVFEEEIVGELVPKESETPTASSTEEEGGQGGSIHDLKQLPKEINLAVPFTSQAPEKNWDQPWQDACEEAAVLMIEGYYKDFGLSPIFARDEILKMVQWEETQNWGRSIEIEKIKRLVERAMPNAHPRIVTDPTVEELKEFIASGNPVLVVADGKLLENPYFTAGGPVYHALVIRGYTETEFITNDPGTQFGENFSYSYQNLMASIRDWNGGDVKNGTRAVLVLQ